MNYKGEGGTQNSQGVIGLGGAAGPGSILTISTLGHQILKEEIVIVVKEQFPSWVGNMKIAQWLVFSNFVQIVHDDLFSFTLVLVTLISMSTVYLITQKDLAYVHTFFHLIIWHFSTIMHFSL